MALCMNPRCDGKTYLCGNCRKLYPMLAASLGKGKKRGSQPVQLGGSDNFPRREQGSRKAKRQNQKNHGTNRKGGGYR